MLSPRIFRKRPSRPLGIFSEVILISAIFLSGFFLLAWLKTSPPMNSYYVQTVPEVRDILSRLRPGDTLTLKSGVYELSSPLILNVNGITFQGEGDETVLRLKDGANSPVLFVGLDEAEPSEFVSDVTVRNLRIDGNRSGQSSEHWREPGEGGWFTNNGITFRQVKNSKAENIKVHSTASGGIVFALRCYDIELRGITSWDNAFDGIAWDGEVRRALIADSLLFENLYSGISFDIDVEDSVVENTVSRNNHKTGLFARVSSNNQIRNSEFTENEDGVFLADGDKRLGHKGSTNNIFENCKISRNSHTGVWQAGKSSTGNSIRSSQIQGNGYLDIDNSFPDTAPLVILP